jgi:hypothetical protein
MIDKRKDIFKYMNEQGLMIPMLRDHGKPSVSVTLLVISSILVIAGICSVDNVNTWQALAWFVTNAVIYNNRGAKISKDGIEITQNSQENK